MNTLTPLSPRQPVQARRRVRRPATGRRRRPGRSPPAAGAGRRAAPAPRAARPAPAPVGELAGGEAVGVVLVAEQVPLPQRVVGVLDGQRLPTRARARPYGRRRRAARSRVSGASDQPSPAMWCRSSRTVHSSSPVRNTWTRSGEFAVQVEAVRAGLRQQLRQQVVVGVDDLERDADLVAAPGPAGGPGPRRRGRRCAASRAGRPRRRRAARSASTSSAPVSRRPSGMLYVALAPSTRLRNHSRCWAEDSGSRSGRGRTAERRPARTRPWRPPPGVARARPPSAPRTPYAATARRRAPPGPATSRIASSEWPPRSKKSSSTPTRATPSTSANSPHRISSRGVRGPAARAAAGRKSGAGSALRSSLPFGGQRQRVEDDDGRGHHVLGQRGRRCDRAAPPGRRPRPAAGTT